MLSLCRTLGFALVALAAIPQPGSAIEALPVGNYARKYGLYSYHRPWYAQPYRSRSYYYRPWYTLPPSTLYVPKSYTYAAPYGWSWPLGYGTPWYGVLPPHANPYINPWDLGPAPGGWEPGALVPDGSGPEGYAPAGPIRAPRDFLWPGEDSGQFQPALAPADSRRHW